jgi:integrase
MGRPGLALGTAGKIRFHATPSGYRAVAWYRDYDGRCRQVERSAKTKAAAAAALRLALRDRARFDSGGDLTPDTRVSVLAEAWFAGLKNLSPTTMQVYRHRLDQQILPGLGNLRVRELSVGTIERHLRLVADKHGPAMAKMTKSVLSGVCGLAARHDALDRNPVRDTGSIEAPARKAPRALTGDEARTLLTRLAADEQAGRNDVTDLVAFMLATGCRIGEATAVTWDVLDLDAGTVEIRSTAVRVTGQGLVRKARRRPRAPARCSSRPGAWRCCAVGLPASAPQKVRRGRECRCSRRRSAGGATPRTPRRTSGLPSQPPASATSPAT